jgi:hypothetical protein
MYTLAQPFVCQMMCACMCECTHIRACPPAGLVCNCIHVHTLARPQMCVCMHVLMHAARAHTGTPAYRPGACVRARARSRAGRAHAEPPAGPPSRRGLSGTQACRASRQRPASCARPAVSMGTTTARAAQAEAPARACPVQAASLARV